MKCPKCLYIGFETGDRCKNCGYDFSLLEEASAAEERAAMDWAAEERAIDRFRDLPDGDAPAMTFARTEDFARDAMITPDTPLTGSSGVIATGLAAATETASETASGASGPPVRAGGAPVDMPALPLFEPDAVDDEPLIRVPAVLRAPLSVRRTPDVPRLRQPAPAERARLHDDAVLQFTEEPDAEDSYSGAYREADPDALEPGDAEVSYDPAARAPFVPRAARGYTSRDDDVSPLGPRLVAAFIDYGMLLSIDAIVLYFTLRLTDLDLADWQLLPMLPLVAFLVALKLAYFTAFTGAGGQTIGKMATHIRVVSDDGGRLDAGRALRRAALALVSIATAGAPFLPALTDPARRGVHDRASGTRVVALLPR